MAYKMKGSPMARNFGIGTSPTKQVEGSIYKEDQTDGATQITDDKGNLIDNSNKKSNTSSSTNTPENNKKKTKSTKKKSNRKTNIDLQVEQMQYDKDSANETFNAGKYRAYLLDKSVQPNTGQKKTKKTS